MLCPDVCGIEHEMETRLKRLSASSMLEFSVCKMAQAMNCASNEKREKR